MLRDGFELLIRNPILKNMERCQVRQPRNHHLKIIRSEFSSYMDISILIFNSLKPFKRCREAKAYLSNLTSRPRIPVGAPWLGNPSHVKDLI